MKAYELIGKGGCNAFAALDLFELTSPLFLIEQDQTGGYITKTATLDPSEFLMSPKAINLFIDEDPVDLVKGLCFIMFFAASHWLCGDASPTPVFSALRESADNYAANSDDPDLNLEGQYRALDLLGLIEKDTSGSFYVIAHSLRNPFDTAVSLCSMLTTLIRLDLGKEPTEVIDFMRSFLVKKLV